MAGTQLDPVKRLTLRNLTFTATRETMLDGRWTTPSGGDWALNRNGAVFVEGSQGLVIEHCTFTRLDSTALFLSRYNRGANITENEFVWLGQNAMAAWGETDGVDGTGGEQPRGTRVVGNVCHEIGHYQKQSSCWFQAKTAQTVLRANIFFNGPRAMINMNDGFGGGNVVEQNLLFNSCRDSGDHGPFNSWDRQPFLTDIRNGTPSLLPAWNELHHNFVVRALRFANHRGATAIAVPGERTTPTERAGAAGALGEPPYVVCDIVGAPTTLMGSDRVLQGGCRFAALYVVVPDRCAADCAILKLGLQVSNYNANGGCFDTDDGSAWYDIHHNVCWYGGHKSTNGFSKRTHDNLNIFPQVYGAACAGMFGLPKPTADGTFDEGFYNNTCILAGSNGVYFKTWETLAEMTPPSAPKLPIVLGGNRLFSDGGSPGVTVCMGGHHPIGGCLQQPDERMSMAQWLAKGLDPDTRYSPQLPTDDEIMAWVHEMLSV